MTLRALRRLAILAGALAAGTTLSCSRASQAEACASDQVALGRVLQHDQRVGTMLGEVDALAASGNGVEAANRIDKAARPEAARVIDETSQLQLRTRWGRARQQELRALAEQRSSTLSDYSDALRSDNLERVVKEMTTQRDLEKRALTVQQAIAGSPDPSTDQCAPP